MKTALRELLSKTMIKIEEEPSLPVESETTETGTLEGETSEIETLEDETPEIEPLENHTRENETPEEKTQIDDAGSKTLRQLMKRLSKKE